MMSTQKEMTLAALWLNRTVTPQVTLRFRVVNCPWLIGEVTSMSQSGATVKFKTPNQPYGDNDKPADTPIVGNYTGPISVSPQTKVTPL